jgi:FkbM family methyltransferase
VLSELPTLKKQIQAALQLAGYQLTKIRKPVPDRNWIDVFSLCMRELLARSPKPFILQIGANDGVRADPVYPFITDHRLSSLLIEPHPVLFGVLKDNYSSFPEVRLANIAIADSDVQTVSLYAPNDELLESNQRLSGLCSLDRDRLARSLRMFGFERVYSLIQELSVPARTVRAMLREQDIDKIDILQIDAEGYDWKLLQQFDLTSLNVQLINFEFFNLTHEEQSDCVEFVTSHGYETAVVRGDMVAMRSSSPAKSNHRSWPVDRYPS